MDLVLTVRYLDDLTALNVTVPAKAQAAADTFRAVLETASTAPTDGLRDGIVTGTLTPDNVVAEVDAAALALAAKLHAQQIIRDLHITFNKVIRDALREDADRITAELRATFTPAAEKVTEAGKHFGPATTAGEVVKMKPDVVKRWNELSSHVSTLNAVSAAYRALLADVLRDLPDVGASLFVARGADVYEADETYRQPDNWLGLAQAGYTLRLNSAAEAREVIAHADRLRLEAEQRRREGTSGFRSRRPVSIGSI